MQVIKAIIKLEETGPQVANLQEALSLLIERKVIRALDPPNHPASEELQKLTDALKKEREQSFFGKTTAALVRYFQIQQGLGDSQEGTVDEKTAAKLNEILKPLGAFEDRVTVPGGRLDDVLKPAKPAVTANLDDLLNAALAPSVSSEARKAVIEAASGMDHESETFIPDITKAGISEADAIVVRRMGRLFDITGGNMPLSQALSQTIAQGGGDYPCLAKLTHEQWLGLAFTHAPQGSDPVALAATSQRNLEDKAPTAVLAAQLSAGRFTVSHAGFDGLSKVLYAHPEFDIVRDDIDLFAEKFGITPETAGALRILNQAKRMGSYWEEVPPLVHARAYSPAIVAEFGRDQFCALLNGHLKRERAEQIHAQALKIRATGIGLMGHMMSVVGGVSSNVTRTYKSNKRSSEIISKAPSLRSLFGALERCNCDPDRSVLSPAAYLADLLRFIDFSGNAGWVLRDRVTFPYDMELSGDNTHIEIPYIDLVNEILENAIAFPHRIPLPSGTGMDGVITDLGKGSLPVFIRDELQKTDIAPLPGNLAPVADPWDEQSPAQQPGISHWIIRGSDRSWVLKTVKEKFWVMMGTIPGAEMPLAGISTLVDGMDQGKLPSPLEPAFNAMLVESLKPRIPASVTKPVVIKTLKTGLSWEVAVTLGGRVEIKQANRSALLTSDDGSTTKPMTYTPEMQAPLLEFLKSGNVRGLEGILNQPGISKVTSTQNPAVWHYELSRKVTMQYQADELTIQGLTCQSVATDADLFERVQHRNPLAYEILKNGKSRYPWTLPYDEDLAETRALLEKAGCSRARLIEMSAPANAGHAGVASEMLGLEPSLLSLIITQIKRPDELWHAWGLKPDSSGEVSLYDTFSDEEVGGSPQKVLSVVSIILQQARLSPAEFHDIMQTDFVNPHGLIQVEPECGCDPSKLRIKEIEPVLFNEFFDRLHRFVRLWRLLGWHIWEVDLALMCGADNADMNSPGQRRLHLKEHVTDLAILALLRSRLDLPVDVLVTWFKGFSGKRYITEASGTRIEITPLYERVFQNRRVLSPPDPDLAWANVSQGAAAKTLAFKLPVVGAALGLRGTTLEALLGLDVPATPSSPPIVIVDVSKDSKLTAENLKNLYRNASLIKALGLSPEELKIAHGFFGNNRFSSPDAMLSFCGEIEFIRGSGFSLADLDYSLCKKGEEGGALGLTAARALRVLAGLQQGADLAVPAASEQALSHFASSQDLAQLPSIPGNDTERWGHWRIQILGNGNGTVPDPADTTNVIEDAPLNLLAQFPILAQQGGITIENLNDALKTRFVDPAEPRGLSVGGTIAGLTTTHLDRLERLLALWRITGLSFADLDALIGAFWDRVTTPDALQFDLTRLLATDPQTLVSAAQALLTIRDRYGVALTKFERWFALTNVPASSVKQSVIGGLLQFDADVVSKVLEQAADPLQTPQGTLGFIEAISAFKRRADAVVLHLAQEFGLAALTVSRQLWAKLTPTQKPPIDLFVSDSFWSGSKVFAVETVCTTKEYAALVQLHKLALVNSVWKATPEELRWLDDVPTGNPRFQGLISKRLGEVVAPDKQNDAYLDWKRSTTLFALAHSAKEWPIRLDAYLKSLGSTTTPSIPDAQEELGRAFGCSKDDVSSALPGLADCDYFDPVSVSRLIALLGSLQRLGITSADLKLLVSTTSDSSMVALRVLQGRLGEPGWREAARKAMNDLREQRRDRLVDYLLWRDGLRSAEDLYKRYLIDVEMSSCMNTTRLLQAISAAQLFIQRCLLNLEPAVSPEWFVRAKLEWIQNYRIWEANRKIFLWPENWLLPELRDDRTETFRAFEAALRQKEPSHENAVQAVQTYLEGLLEVSRIEVVGMYEDSKLGTGSDETATLYLVGRTQGTPHTYYWRRALHYGQPGMRWTGWERIDLDITSDYVLLFVWEKELYIAWPQIATKDDNRISYYEVKMAWARKTSEGWAKRTTSQKAMAVRVEVLDHDIGEMFTFRIRRAGDALSLSFDVYAQTPDSQEVSVVESAATLEFGSRANTSKIFWSLDHKVTNCSVRYEKPKEHLVKLDDPSCYRLAITGIVKETLNETIAPGHGGRVDILPGLFDDIKGLIDRYRDGLPDDEKNKLNALIGLILIALGAAVAASVAAPWASSSTMNLFYELVVLIAAQFSDLADQIKRYLDAPVYRVTRNTAHRLEIGTDIPLPIDRVIAFEKAEASGTPKHVEIGASYEDEITLQLQGFPDGVSAGTSITIALSLLFKVEEDQQYKKTPVPTKMRSVGSFELCPGLDDGQWKSPLVDENGRIVIEPLKNSRFVGNGFEEAGGVTLGFLRPSFPESMWVISASSMSSESKSRTWYVTEGGHKLLAKYVEGKTYGYDERGDKQVKGNGLLVNLYPAGYSAVARYISMSMDSFEGLFTKVSENDCTWFDEDAIESWLGPKRTKDDPRDNKNLGFDLSIPNANYNYEMGLHVPVTVADFLAKQHRFDDARRWFHFVFDPTTTDSTSGRERYWRFLPFKHANKPVAIEQLLEALANPKGDSNLKSEITSQIEAWQSDPFNPFAVARLRTSAFEWHTVNTYIKSYLIAHGDYLFRCDTRESINQATLLYVLAAELLGRRPARIPECGKEAATKSYRLLCDRMDAFSNAWVTLADSWNTIGGNSSPRALDPLSSVGSTYFCVPANDRLLELWDTVEDRLFKIRHCQNIDGVTRSLPLFEPPIDPELLIRAKAAGLDIADILSDVYAPLPYYRFNVSLAKANELCNDVKALGAALLSAIEKKESEHIALIRSSQEIALLKEIETIREQQVKEAEINLDALKQTRVNVLARFTYTQKLLGIDTAIDEGSPVPSVDDTPSHVSNQTPWFATGTPAGLGLIGSEYDQIGYMNAATLSNIAAGLLRTASGAAHCLGNVKDGYAFSAFGDAAGTVAAGLSHQDRWSGMVASWQRRRDEWKHQAKMVADELKQIDKQIVALEIRKQISDKELENHRKQMEHATNIDDYMRHAKFANESLHFWMESRVSDLYFSTYQMAYDLAKKAERAFRFEVGDESAHFIQFGYWDSMRKGLLAGECLSRDLKRMEVAYLDQNRREQEITKHVSLGQLDPMALVNLRDKGECEFEIPEALFDLDFPGHYLRRIKSVSISVPCVVGPYTSISGTLTLLSSKLREKSLISGNGYGDEPNYRSNYLPIQSISTSAGQNDSGLFELNFRDERYLPFEGAGAISRWRFKLSKEFRAFDYDTISDLILHIRYTARESETLASSATASITNSLNTLRCLGSESGLMQLFSIRHDFPTEWAQYLAGETGTRDLIITLGEHHFPYMFKSKIQLTNWVMVSNEGTDNINILSNASFPIKITIQTDIPKSDNPYLGIIYKLKIT